MTRYRKCRNGELELGDTVYTPWARHPGTVIELRDEWVLVRGKYGVTAYLPDELHTLTTLTTPTVKKVI